MDTATFQLFSVIIGGVQMVALVVVLLVYQGQLRTMRRQLETSRETAAAQNLISLASFLQAEDVREARRIVIQELSLRPLSSWTEEEKRTASKVCSSYVVAGLLLESGLVDSMTFIEAWGPSVVICHNVLTPYINEIRKDKAGPTYWIVFDRLSLKCSASSIARQR